MQSIDSTETYVYAMGKDIIYVKEKIKRYNIIQRCLTSTVSQKKTYAKDPYKAKYQLLIKKKESAD